MIHAYFLLAQATPGDLPIPASAYPTHADVVGWTGTILSIATAFTGGFVMMYQRVQRARRDNLMEWMKLKQGSLQALLEQANNERVETREEVKTLTAKFNAVTRRNNEQHEQIIELTHHLTRLGILIARLPGRLGLVSPPANSSEVVEGPSVTLDSTVAFLEGLVERLRETTQVLGKIAEIDAERPAEPESKPKSELNALADETLVGDNQPRLEYFPA